MDETEREALRQMLRRRAEARTQTQEMARRWLIDEGLYSEAGELLPQYGGQERKNDEE
jgi:hypothetical protein